MKPPLAWWKNRGWELRTAALLGLAVFLASALVDHREVGWNAATRIALVFAVVEEGRFTIDTWAEITGDKAVFEGHFYSDKVFGVSLLAVPMHAVYYWGSRLIGAQPNPLTAEYLCRVWAVSLPAGVAMALLWSLLVRLGGAPRRALAVVALLFFGSLLYGYSTVFFPYAAGLAATLGALWLVLFPPAHRLTGRNSFAIGLLCGFGLLCDFLFGLVVLGVGVLHLLRLMDQLGIIGLRAFAEMKGDRTRLRGALAIWGAGALGGALPLALFAAYCISIFGSPTIPYMYEESETFREGMAQGFMGSTWPPNAAAAWFLSFHPYRGLFLWSPLFLLATAGLAMSLHTVGKRGLVALVFAPVVALHFLYVAGYYMWWGGWSMGPRLLIPVLGVWALGLAALTRRDAARWVFPLLCAAGAWSLLANLPLSWIDPQLPQGNPHDVLAQAGLPTSLAVPQFEFLRAFYSVEFWRSAPAEWIITRLAALLVPAGLLVWAGRGLPEKHLISERPEVPFATVDGTAAPPPPVAVRA